jgi:hypothetical protein
MPKRAKKSDWIVTIECTITKEVYVKNCTEEEAKEPWQYAIDEREVEMTDWKFLSIEENV